MRMASALIKLLGPHDAVYLFDRFIGLMEGRR